MPFPRPRGKRGNARSRTSRPIYATRFVSVGKKAPRREMAGPWSPSFVRSTCSNSTGEDPTACADRNPQEHVEVAAARQACGHRVQRSLRVADGAIVYRQACALGCEGIVSKRLGSPYRSGRADCWLKVKNPAAPAITREAEEEWN
jgi:hypothetical protein